ncbi:TetR/AcrR family transcriptional regulator [Actinokineospora enzanensis]|uniref:TetR/AcrR family transcriptional regulator n=1 Tax=Actinokineospora enzanensis TaxID=155975 RepID=UPI00035CCC65|nr:TetR/AcrR family transcriptional regulator [Actinokineospora enzanensis]
MARPKAYDPDRVLDGAMKAFWGRGFHATSAQDLVDSTGLGRGSLYHAFVSKEQLFHEALRRYESVWTTRQERLLAGGGTLHERVRALLMAVVDEESAPDEPRGCFAVNTAIELADHDPAARRLVAAVFRRMEQALTHAIRDGEPAMTDPPEDLARHVLSSMYGLRVLGKTMPRAHLESIVAMVLRPFEKPTQRSDPA